jgi:hypothetical protein
MIQLYRIEYEFSTGWNLIEESAHSLTKEHCDYLISYYLSQGYNPNYLKVRKELPETKNQ